MAIAFDTANSQYTGSGTTNTISMTLGASADILIAFAMGVGRNVTGITWNGVAMTQFATVTSSAGDFRSYGFYLLAPATGTHNLISTISSSGETYLGGISYSGAKQSGQPDASATSNPVGAGTSLVQSVTTVADNSWTACIMLGDAGGVAAGTGSTQRASILNGALGFFDSNGAKTPAGSTSMTQTCNSGVRAGIIVSIAPAVAAASATPRRRMVLGIG